MLAKNLGISSSIRPKGKEKCFTLSICSRDDVLNFLSFIYPNDSFIILKRKYLKYCALRLELEENGECGASREYRAEPAEQEGVETSGVYANKLNDRIMLCVQQPSMIRRRVLVARSQSAMRCWICMIKSCAMLSTMTPMIRLISMTIKQNNQQKMRTAGRTMQRPALNAVNLSSLKAAATSVSHVVGVNAVEL